MFIYDVSDPRMRDAFEDSDHETNIVCINASPRYMQDLKGRIQRRVGVPYSDVALVHARLKETHKTKYFLNYLNRADAILFKFNQANSSAFYMLFGYFMNRKKYLITHMPAGTNSDLPWLQAILWENNRIRECRTLTHVRTEVSKLLCERRDYLNREVI